MNPTRKLPVTVLTGFLGAGKTTLLNRILTENHGLRLAVIENEFGEVGIDHELVINADEEIFEMNNGCICCTVRGDLIRIIGIDPRFLDPEYPFEWGGILEAPAGTLTFEATENPDPSMTAVLIPVSGIDDETLAFAREIAVRAFSHDATEAPSGTVLTADAIPYDLILHEGPMGWTCEIEAPGPLAIFTQHYPEELNESFRKCLA